ncbi:MAG: hypothetical protein ACPHHQ_08080 [Pseudomonadales bacterium]
MRAVERIAAQKGVENISIREILTAAQQKNESALQYHFKNFSGLLAAVRADRAREIDEARRLYIDQVIRESNPPSLRQICEIMVMPPFRLAKASPSFRHFVKAFSHELAHMDEQSTKVFTQHMNQSSDLVIDLLRAAVPHLDKALFFIRIQHALKLTSIAMSTHAQKPGAFRGKSTELFVHSLIDSVEGLLSAPVSKATQSALKK